MRMWALSLVMVVGFAGLRAEPAEPHNSAWVTQRVQQLQPTALDRSWENIGWAKSLAEALRLGKEHGRPVFLFTHDGRLNVGRC